MTSKKEVYGKELENCVDNIEFYQNEIERMKEKIDKLKEVLKDYNF